MHNNSENNSKLLNSILIISYVENEQPAREEAEQTHDVIEANVVDASRLNRERAQATQNSLFHLKIKRNMQFN